MVKCQNTIITPSYKCLTKRGQFDAKRWGQFTTKYKGSICREMRGSDCAEYPVYGLSRAEVKLLFDAANSITERIILHLHYSLGLRRAESFKLTIDEVLLEKKIIIVKNGKYGKRREIPLLDSIITDFIRYSVYRTEIISSTGLSHKFFLVTTKGEPSDYAFAYGLVKSMAKRAGVLEGHVTLHQLRHSIATHLKEAGVPLEFVKQLLGHLNEATTMGYMNASTHQLKKRLRYGTSK